jgi:hypothetical protein
MGASPCFSRTLWFVSTGICCRKMQILRLLTTSAIPLCIMPAIPTPLMFVCEFCFERRRQQRLPLPTPSSNYHLILISFYSADLRFVFCALYRTIHFCCRFLISQGCDVDCQTTEGNSVVWVAANNGSLK